ncbi:HNH endonuclease [Mesorhizobium sp. B2-6-3]|uniref:HNH endonuclease signature motif containing protein n=1 Tax=Mesorhizobium sp. B2-6-3 TaxID=2589914 RepID=UPI0011278093|nr:HNH endonuclease signature motif containing protein [Mesorhizobium sp. B2-6-3]TPJ75809.1 HNH endonuclease [Mesorhizobium sp. B2-6-3]
MTLPLTRREVIRAKIAANIEVVDTGYETPCHLWIGPDSGNGRGGDYPRMKLDGQTVAVHRVSFTNEHGYIPGKKQLDHKCRTRRCVRDDHLEMVTHKQNQKRRDEARGLTPKRKRRRKAVAK